MYKIYTDYIERLETDLKNAKEDKKLLRDQNNRLRGAIEILIDIASKKEPTLDLSNYKKLINNKR